REPALEPGRAPAPLPGPGRARDVDGGRDRAHAVVRSRSAAVRRQQAQRPRQRHPPRRPPVRAPARGGGNRRGPPPGARARLHGWAGGEDEERALRTGGAAEDEPRTIVAWRSSGGASLLETRQWLPQPIERVFPFFADPGNLERITPPWLSFRILPPAP